MVVGTTLPKLISLRLSVGGYNLRDAERDIFATSNSLKSRAARKLKSPFSNIHAVTSKLCRHSRPTGMENRPTAETGATLKSP